MISKMPTLPRAKPRRRLQIPTQEPPPDDPIERRAMELYDQYNPDQERVINVSKAECIKIAKRELG